MGLKTVSLSGWGRTTQVTSLAARPERLAEAQRAFASAPDSHSIVYGAGRSYGDQALPVEDGTAVLTERLNRITAFDPATGHVTCEPGVKFRTLLRTFVPKGYGLPVTPGTAFATMGGALANDVHGKNHDVAGSFGDHVVSFDLILPDGTPKTVTAQDEPELFRATVGGAGLTGFVTSVTLKLPRLEGDCVHRREIRIKNIDHYLDAYAEENAAGTPYLVGWIDGTARGKNLGRGILEAASPSPETLDKPRGGDINVPLDFPSFSLNSLSVKAFNALYLRRVPKRGRDALVPYEGFYYPLDALSHWNRIYGKRGFHQFQCVVPYEGGREALIKMLEVIAKSGAASFLSVLKTLGGEGQGYLSFPMRGYTLALDFPARAKASELIAQLHRMTLDAGGRVYLAKDSLVDGDTFNAMYPKATLMREALAKIDPQGRMASPMSRRLGLSGGQANG